MISVLIVDDHPIVRKGLRSELSEQTDIRVVEEAADADEALLKARACKPDIVLLDISLPGKSGLEVLRQLRAEAPHMKVLMLSTYSEKQYAIRSLKGGASGYLSKESASEDLVTAIRKVAEGKKYVSAQFGEILASQLGTKADMLPHEQLSAREFEILCLLGRGRTPTEIAGILSVGLSTISTHRSHILAKMQCHSTAQLIHYALEHGLVDQTG